MTLTLPIVEPVAIKLKDKLKHKFAAVEVSNDYGTINLLFLYYVPSLPDDKKSDFDAIQDEFQTWHAWELGQAEAQLNAHVEAGNLPSNDSITSRITRNNYRSKAIGFFRETSEAWLVLAGTSINDKTIETTQDAAIAEITVELKNLIRVNSLQSQFGVIINAITSSIDVANNNKFFFTHVYYRYDSESRKFLPVVLDTTITITKVEGSGGKEVEEKLTTKVALLINNYNFDRKLWRDVRHEGEDAIKMGESIRKEMAMNFRVNS